MIYGPRKRRLSVQLDVGGVYREQRGRSTETETDLDDSRDDARVFWGALHGPALAATGDSVCEDGGVL